ncbi:tyrosine-type recombinase/integrase [Chitinophaga sp. NPDC101104]|uniref:tyrosine-type recombinase/integrase n=1 Tax=Chitinophaga sp. NPDC101104 TaxID=3390561 RepID=UPI003D01B507
MLDQVHLPPLAQDFLAWLSLEKRYSPHTVQSYSLDLHQFFQYLQSQYDGIPLESVKASHIKSWLALGLEGRKKAEDARKGAPAPASAVTIRRKMSALRSFFKFALRKGVIQQSPMARVTGPKLPERLPVFVDEMAMEKLAQPPAGEEEPLFGDDFAGVTQRLIMRLLYHAGIRRAELVGLEDKSVDISNGQIKVLGKGNKERIIPVGTVLLKDIRDYFDKRREAVPGYAGRAMLCLPNGKPVQAWDVYRTVRRVLERVTTLKKRSPHVLRHTFATHLVNNGADINAVKELLGHASLASTQVYTHNTIEKLRRVHKQAHPRG